MGLNQKNYDKIFAIDPVFLNFGGHVNISNRWNIRNYKKYCRQIGLLRSVLCLV